MIFGALQNRKFVVASRRIGIRLMRTIMIAAGDKPLPLLSTKSIHNLGKSTHLRRTCFRRGITVDENLFNTHPPKLSEGSRQHDLGVRCGTGFRENRCRQIADNNTVPVFANMRVIEDGNRGQVLPFRSDQRRELSSLLGCIGEVSGNQSRLGDQPIRSTFETVRGSRPQLIDGHKVVANLRLVLMHHGQLAALISADWHERNFSVGRCQRGQLPPRWMWACIRRPRKCHRRIGHSHDFQVRYHKTAGQTCEWKRRLVRSRRCNCSRPDAIDGHLYGTRTRYCSRCCSQAQYGSPINFLIPIYRIHG